MYANAAYLKNPHDDILDTTNPILVTAVGNYRIKKGSQLTTSRPNGRSDYQLLYVSDGSLILSADGGYKKIKKGTVILFRPSVQQIYSPSSLNSTETYWTHFTGRDVEKMLSEYDIYTEENEIYVGLASGIEAIFHRMIEELSLKRENFCELLNLNLKYLLLLIKRGAKSSADANSPMTDEVMRAATYFCENYNKEISIKDYVRQRHINLCLFIRKYKEIFNLTPMQYILSIRIDNAKSLMLTTDCNISEAAEAVGYGNALYFSRLFKKHTGLSPTDYKKRAASSLPKA